MKSQRVLRSTYAVLLVMTILIGVTSATTINSGVITVGASDLQAGQSDPTSGNTDFDFRYSYGTGTDEYFQNGNYSTADQTGWQTACSWYSTNMVRYDMSGDSTYSLNIEPAGSIPGAIMWSFDFSNTGQTIEKLMVRIPLVHGAANDGSFLDINNGSGEQVYQSVTSSGWTLYNDYYDLTSYVQGMDSFMVRAVLYPTWWCSIRMMPLSGTDMSLSMDVQVTLVPEPATCAIIGLSGMLPFIRRRR